MISDTAPAAADVVCWRGFRALGDPIRWAIVVHLQPAPSTATPIAQALDIQPTLLSHHLKILREAGLISGTRNGRMIEYALVDGVLASLAERVQHPRPE